MIIKTIDIYGYGKWIDQQIEFSAPIQVIYGPNEAGKSTIIDFITSILFGFQTKRQAIHGQYQPKHSHAYGGELVFEQDGITYKVIRTAGSHGGNVKFTNLTDEIELTKADFDQIIAPMNRELYSELFYFGGVDQTAFYKMGLDDLRWRIQKIGINNAESWFALQKQIDKQAAELYAPRGRKRVINQQLKQHDDLVEKIQAAHQQFPEYQDLTKQLAVLKQQRLQANQQLADQQKTLQQKQQQSRALPLIKEIDQLQQKTPVQLIDINDHTFELARQLNTQLDSLTQQTAQNQAQVDQIHATIKLDDQQQFLIDHQQQIEELGNQLNRQFELCSQVELLEQQIKRNQQQIDKLTQPLLDNGASRLPDLLTDTEISQVNQFLQLTSARSPKKVKANSAGVIIGWVMAMVMLILGLFTNRVLIIIGVSIIGGIIGYQWYQKKQPISNDSVETGADNELPKHLIAIGKRTGLDNFPIDQWVSVQGQIRQINDLNNNLDIDVNQQSNLKKQLQDYLVQWHFVDHWLFNPNLDNRQQLENVQQLVNTAQQLQKKQQQKKQQLQIIDQLQQTNQQELNQKRIALQKILNDNQVQSITELKQLAEEQKQQQQNQSRLNMLQQQLEQLHLTTDLNVNSLTEINAATNQLEQEVNQHQSEINQLSNQISEAQTRLDMLAKDGSYYDLRQRLNNLQTEINANVTRWLGLQFAQKWLELAMNIATKGRVPKTLERTSKYFNIMTNQHYVKVNFEDQITVVAADGTSFEIKELSRGTLEQLYLALVLALAVGFSDEMAFPIIIDDGFVNFDVYRTQASVELVHEISKTNQIIFVTADKRQAEMFSHDAMLNLTSKEEKVND